VERHSAVGGYCSGFRRGGYTFDAATHFYPLLGNPATMTGRLLADLGIRTSWIKMDPVDRFHFPDGSSFNVPADFETYLARLKAGFPDEATALDEFFTTVRQAYLLGLLCYFRWRDTRRLDAYRDLTLRAVLDRFFRSPRLKLLLTADCAHWGSPPCRTSFVFDSMLRLSYFLGNYYPRGGSQAFADGLAQRFEERGGHVLLNTPVTRIAVRHGQACGVVLGLGPPRARTEREVGAGAVISNADLRQTVDHLLDPAALPPEYVAAVRRLRPSYACFLMHIGVRGVPTDALEAVHGYHWDSWDADQVGATALKFKLFVPTLYEPALAPPGGHVLIIQKVTEMDYASVTDWPAHKEALAAAAMDGLGRLLPGLSEKIVVSLSASAATSFRYTRNHHGAMLGWEMSPDQVGDGRPAVAGPVPNLWLVGHWTQPGGGITPVIISAVRAVEQLTGPPATDGGTGAAQPGPAAPFDSGRPEVATGCEGVFAGIGGSA
jgi:phytoene dehydrogenase-like protein